MRATTPLAAGALIVAMAAPLVATADQAGAVSPCGAPVIVAGVATVTCAYSGTVTTWTVPPAVTSLGLTLYGASGGDAYTAQIGLGGETQATAAVVPGTILSVSVGGVGGTGFSSGSPGLGGFGGGGSGGAGTGSLLFPGSGGGGASAVSDGSGTLAVAGGGGGGTNDGGAYAGAGGGSSGGNGVSLSGGVVGVGGLGGTQAGPGTGANGTSGLGVQGGPGVPGADGVGCNPDFPSYAPAGGGGGGGYYGGAGGEPCASGGGGSGYVAPSDTATTLTSGVNAGNGSVVISYTVPHLTSTPNVTSVTLGTTSPTLTDSASLSGDITPIGTITFTLHLGATQVDSETVTVNGNGTYTTPSGYALPTSGTVVGTYQWDATYSGDLNNTGASDTNDPYEQVTVGAASPMIATTPGATSVTLGGPSPTLTDEATLADGYFPTGTITFTLYLGSTLVDTEPVSVSGNGSYFTPTGYTLPTTGTVAGTYQWDASYTGDGNNYTVADNGNADERTIASKGNQTISFAPLPDATFGQAPFGLSATATSGLAVAYTSTTPGVCAVSGSTVTILHAGWCTIDANQPGSSLWNAAPMVSRSFTVDRATMPVPTALSVTAAGGVVTATWAPVGPATSYTCTLLFGFGDSTGFSVTSATPTCDFVGLDLSRSWGVSVVATSSTGDWTASAPTVGFSAAVPPHAPRPPAAHHAPGRPAIAVTSRSAGTITIALVGRTPTGGDPITGFEYSLNGGPWTVITANVHHALVIGGLVSGRTYSVRLRALNGVGAGPSSVSVSVRVS